MKSADIEFHSVHKRYGSFVALDNVSLRIESGEFFALLGPSGSGKSTLLGALAGFIPLTGGDITVNQKRIDGMPPHKRNIGMVFQHYSLFPFLTVAENVAFPLDIRGMAKQAKADAVAKMLDMVRLSDFAERYPKQLSGGQQQRVALARAAVYDPPLLLMDEPLGALDKKLREEMQYEIKSFHSKIGSSILYVTHDQEEAASMADRIAIMKDGRLTQCGTPRELYERPNSAFVANFLGEANVFEIVKGQENVEGFAITRCGLRIRQNTAAPYSAELRALIRPEQIQFCEGGSGANCYSGFIEDVVYFAGFVRYRVRVLEGPVVTIRYPLHSITDRPIGMPVSIGWNADDTRFIRGD